MRTARAGIEQVDRRFEAVASTLGARPLRVFFTITLPLAAPAVVAGAVLGFARAIGEFGATIMIAGSLPSTRTLAVSIYTFAETGRDREAAVLACRVRGHCVRGALPLEPDRLATTTAGAGVRRRSGSERHARMIELAFTLTQGAFTLTSTSG